MAFEFRLPDIGEGVVEGEIVAWKVALGDAVAEDQPLVEVMTDKATVEIPSPRAGTVTALNGGEGDVVEVGAVIVVLDEGDGAEAPAAEAPAAEVGEATERLAAPEAGPASETLEVPKAPKAAPAAAAPKAAAAKYALPKAPGKVLATPATRRVARELGVELGEVVGTGPGGRITKADVVAFSEGRRTPTAGGSAGGAGLGFDHIPVPPGSGPEERVKVIGLRRKIAEGMVRSARTIPHFSYVDELDMTELVQLRKDLNVQLLAQGKNKVSYLPFIMKACQVAFRDHPEVNALFDNTTGEVVYKKYFNCGLATDTPNGLFVSVIRDVEGKSIIELGEEIREVTGRVRAGKGTLQDLTDSTFTITSIGNIGGLFATPIINYPEVAILGVNKIAPRPVVRDGEIVVRQMTHLSPSFDHRIVDGANGARFTSRLKVLLENPGQLLAYL
jgi:pyruvate/2-oxoglutarate dehydrogenase complex dihydrolipoamide acyltransferase (E2) component